MHGEMWGCDMWGGGCRGTSERDFHLLVHVGEAHAGGAELTGDAPWRGGGVRQREREREIERERQG